MGSQPTDPSAPLRTRIYIDGYNLYYGALRGTPYKWLDLMTLFERHILPGSVPPGQARKTMLLPLAIKYFSAVIIEQAARAPDSVGSQARYHSALTKLYGERIECIKGYYSLIESKAKIVDAENPKKWPRDCQEILVWKLEEKQSDVNLALQAYHDASTGAVDQLVVVTNDTDIAPALAMIRQHTSAIIGLVIPTRDHQRVPNTDLARLAHWVRTHVTADELRGSQLPRVIAPGSKRPTIKPDSWYARPDLLEKVLALAAPIRGSRGAAFKWLEEANPYLDGEVPIDLVETEEGAQRVLDYIEQWVREHAGPGQGQS